MAVGDCGYLGQFCGNFFTKVECVSLCLIPQHRKIYIRSIVYDPGLPYFEQLLSVQCDMIIETKMMVSSRLYVTLALQLFYL